MLGVNVFVGVSVGVKVAVGVNVVVMVGVGVQVLVKLAVAEGVGVGSTVSDEQADIKNRQNNAIHTNKIFIFPSFGNSFFD